MQTDPTQDREPAQAPPPGRTVLLTAEQVDNLRRNCHADYNGGHRDDYLDVFHHGMETVCNVLASMLSEAAPPSAAPTLADEWEYTGHYAHHDPKGTAGANCPACQADARNRERYAAALRAVSARDVVSRSLYESVCEKLAEAQHDLAALRAAAPSSAAAEPRDTWPDGSERIRVECVTCDAVHDLKRDTEGRWRIRVTSSAAARPVQDDALDFADSAALLRLIADKRTMIQPGTLRTAAEMLERAVARLRTVPSEPDRLMVRMRKRDGSYNEPFLLSEGITAADVLYEWPDALIGRVYFGSAPEAQRTVPAAPSEARTLNEFVLDHVMAGTVPTSERAEPQPDGWPRPDETFREWMARTSPPASPTQESEP